MAFCHSQRDLVINMVKKLMDNATKTGINATKTAFKRVVQKTVEAAGYLIEIKIAEKNYFKRQTNKNTDERYQQNERQKLCILPEKRQQITDV